MKPNETAAFDIINLLALVPWGSSVTGEYQNEVIFRSSVTILCAAELENNDYLFCHAVDTVVCPYDLVHGGKDVSYLHSVCAW
jgi:hypothetical protein